MELSEIFDASWLALLTRFILNILMVVVIGRFLYYRGNSGKVEFFFTYIALSTIVFVVCILLNHVPVELGFALGLFAVFSVIRFRSIQVTPRELTYMFVSLGFAILNALASEDIPFLRLIASNLMILIVIGIAEILLFRSGKMVKRITYDRLDWVTGENWNEIREDLGKRFGVRNVIKIQVGDMDATKNRVQLRVTFIDKTGMNYQEL